MHTSRAALDRLLDPELIMFGSDSATKEEAIKEVIDTFYAVGRTDQPRAVEDAVWAREAEYSTGFGHGFAIQVFEAREVRDRGERGVSDAG